MKTQLMQFSAKNHQNKLLLAIAIITLFIVTLSAHGSALNGSWRFDDGLHLAFANRYSPWQYFFIPEITRLQSGINVTPWNILTYDINLSLFGLDPRGAYAHQILSLWLVTVSTFALLRLWVNVGWAFFGALLFVLGAPTVHIAQELMTGHYLEGLLFIIAALYCFVYASRNKKIIFALLGTLFYLAAVSCKEIYVPLILILPLISAGTEKDRILYSLPFFLVAIAYIPWRYAVLGSLGAGRDLGFDPLAYNSYLWILHTISQLPNRLFGDGALVGAVLLGIGSLTFGYFYRRCGKLPLFFIGLFLSLSPLLPVAGVLNEPAQGRLLFFPWWVISIFLSLVFSALFQEGFKLLRYGVVLVAASTTMLSAHAGFRELDAISNVLDIHDKISAFVLSSHSGQIVFDDSRIWYPPTSTSHFLIGVEKSINPNSPTRAKVLMDPYKLSATDFDKASVWSYNTDCRCMLDVTKNLAVTAHHHYVEVSEIHPLSVNFTYESGAIKWRFGPNPDDSYFIADVDGYFYSALPSAGKLDRAQVYVDFLRSVYVYRTASDGVTTRSDLLHFNLNKKPMMK